MYAFYISNARTEKKLRELIEQRNDIKGKLKKLKNNPRKETGAHPLHGRLKGKWSCC